MISMSTACAPDRVIKHRDAGDQRA